MQLYVQSAAQKRDYHWQAPPEAQRPQPGKKALDCHRLLLENDKKYAFALVREASARCTLSLRNIVLPNAYDKLGRPLIANILITDVPDNTARWLAMKYLGCKEEFHQKLSPYINTRGSNFSVDWQALQSQLEQYALVPDGSLDDEKPVHGRQLAESEEKELAATASAWIQRYRLPRAPKGSPLLILSDFMPQRQLPAIYLSLQTVGEPFDRSHPIPRFTLRWCLSSTSHFIGCNICRAASFIWRALRDMALFIWHNLCKVYTFISLKYHRYKSSK